MTTCTPARPRRRKPLPPAEVTVGHLAYSRSLGVGTLDLVASDGRAEAYLLTALRVAGRLVGMKMLKLSSGETHEVELAARPWRCTCGDATNRPDRPGGCKHVVALGLAAERLRAE